MPTAAKRSFSRSRRSSPDSSRSEMPRVRATRRAQPRRPQDARATPCATCPSRCVGRPVEQGIEIERMPLHQDELDERVIGGQPPVRDQLEAGAGAVGGVLHLGVPGALQNDCEVALVKAGSVRSA